MIRIHFLARKCQQQLKFVTSKFHVRTDCTDSDEGLVTTQLQIATEMTAVPKGNSSSCRCDCVAEVGRHEETLGLKRHTGCNVSSRLEPGGVAVQVFYLAVAVGTASFGIWSEWTIKFFFVGTS